MRMRVFSKKVLEAECSTAKVEHTEFRVRQRFVANRGQARSKYGAKRPKAGAKK